MHKRRKLELLISVCTALNKYQVTVVDFPMVRESSITEYPKEAAQRIVELVYVYVGVAICLI